MKFTERNKYIPRYAPIENIMAMYIKDGDPIPSIGDQMLKRTNSGWNMRIEIVGIKAQVHSHDRTLYVFQYRKVKYEQE